MRIAHFHLSQAVRYRRSGITLIEVLAAIFVMGVGLLAILALFPIGALELARAIRDDRAVAVAYEAVALSQAGEDVLSHTKGFVVRSILRGSADPKIAAELRREYEQLEIDAAGLDNRLRSLRPLITDPIVHHQLDMLLLQIRTIKLSFDTLGRLLRLLE